MCSDDFSFGKESLDVAKAHMTQVLSAGFVAGVSLVSILQVGDWASVSTPAMYYSSTYITTTDWHQDSVQ